MASDERGEHLETLPVAGGAPGGVRPAPERVGAYRILSLLGEGGFGVVYLAQQEAPVRRQVALKLIKPGMDSARVIARFEAERQALAVMDHPCVAKVFDGGVTDAGAPYFVMELVRGRSITRFCDARRLTINDRLELLIRVCEAVQHAHMKGVIHRDLKPSNILVSDEAGDGPQPKVIDFGVAKALSQRLTERTLFTEDGQVIGTPEYMSPEQAEGSGLDIDTRADVYSLGVIMYELLTGSRPFDQSSLRAAGFTELLRVIREVDPPKPSTRLATLLGGAAPDPGRRARLMDARRAEPGSLRRALRRDLDWVVMKCLEKDRALRYTSPSELAGELRRYLADEPVLAGPPSAWRRTRKFVRRNRAAVAVGGVLAGAAGVGFGGVTLGLIEADRQRARALRALDRETVHRRSAEDRAAELTAVLGFIDTVLAAPDPTIAGRDVRVIDLIGDAVSRARADLADEPLIRASVLTRLGRSLRRLGRPDDAESVLVEALTIREAALGAGDAATLETAAELGKLWTFSGRVGESEPLLRRVLAGVRGGAQLEGDTIGVIGSGLVELLYEHGRHEEAVRVAIEILERADGAEVDPEWALPVLSHLAMAYLYEDRDEEAREAVARADRIAARLPPGHGHVLIHHMSRGWLVWSEGRPLEAEQIYRETIERATASVGEGHPDLGWAIADHAELLNHLGRHDEAGAMLERAIRAALTQVDAEHPAVLILETRMAGTVAASGRLDEAAERAARLLPRIEATFGPNHIRTLSALSDYGLLEVARGEPGHAEELFRLALSRASSAFIAGSIHPLDYRRRLGVALTDLGRREEALRELERVERATRRRYPGEHWRRDAVADALAAARALDADAPRP